MLPIDLTINTDVSVKKALELANTETTIHLLYVEANGIRGLFTALKRYLTDSGKLLGKNEIRKKMERYKTLIQETAPGIRVCNWIVVADSIQSAIEQEAINLGIDLIIVSKKATHSLLSFLDSVVPSMIVKKTGIAVLTVNPEALVYRVRKVVIPVIASEGVQLKMEMISKLCKKFRLNIHLVTFMNMNKKNG